MPSVLLRLPPFPFPCVSPLSTPPRCFSLCLCAAAPLPLRNIPTSKPPGLQPLPTPPPGFSPCCCYLSSQPLLLLFILTAPVAAIYPHSPCCCYLSSQPLLLLSILTAPVAAIYPHSPCCCYLSSQPLLLLSIVTVPVAAIYPHSPCCCYLSSQPLLLLSILTAPLLYTPSPSFLPFSPLIYLISPLASVLLPALLSHQSPSTPFQGAFTFTPGPFRALQPQQEVPQGTDCLPSLSTSPHHTIPLTPAPDLSQGVFNFKPRPFRSLQQQQELSAAATAGGGAAGGGATRGCLSLRPRTAGTAGGGALRVEVPQGPGCLPLCPLSLCVPTSTPPTALLDFPLQGAFAFTPGPSRVLQAQQEVVLRVEVLQQEKRQLKGQEFLVLGSQPLTALRDRIYCLQDRIAREHGKSVPSGCFCIEPHGQLSCQPHGQLSCHLCANRNMCCGAICGQMTWNNHRCKYPSCRSAQDSFLPVGLPPPSPSCSSPRVSSSPSLSCFCPPLVSQSLMCLLSCFSPPVPSSPFSHTPPHRQDVFYDDMRQPGAVRYSAVIVKWNREKRAAWSMLDERERRRNTPLARLPLPAPVRGMAMGGVGSMGTSHTFQEDGAHFGQQQQQHEQPRQEQQQHQQYHQQHQQYHQQHHHQQQQRVRLSLGDAPPPEYSAARMETTRFRDLTVRPGALYVYMHQVCNLATCTSAAGSMRTGDF
ncbi:unnamed protein product [Closterium sp. NIES-54]